ncbi:MAG: hypothetical protein IJ226_05280, partial [Clostridia bacterium]|nr:hypothetical protein [Clostridia bacterium]
PCPGIIDIILNLVITFAILGNANLNVTDEQEAVNLALFVVDAIMKVGVGGSGALVIAAPIMLLFSYTRTSKNKMIGLIIPAAAIVILIFVTLEGFVIATKILGPFSELISKMAGE